VKRSEVKYSYECACTSATDVLYVPVLQVRVGVCIWLAKFLRMSRPDHATRKAEPSDITGQRLASLTATSADSCRLAPRRQTTSASKSSKKSSSSSKNADPLQRQSSRSLLANVLDLEDDFLLLNLSRGEAQRGWMRSRLQG